VVLGVLLMAHPGAGALTLLWMVSSCAVLYGALLLLLAFRVRRFGTGVAVS